MRGMTISEAIYRAQYRPTMASATLDVGMCLTTYAVHQDQRYFPLISVHYVLYLSSHLPQQLSKMLVVLAALVPEMQKR